MIFAHTLTMAQDSKVKKFTFKCSPGHAKIFRTNEKADLDYLGPANEELLITTGKYQEITITAFGYEKKVITLGPKDLNPDVYPVGGDVIELKSTLMTKAVFVLLGLGVVGLLAQPIRARLQRLKALEAEKEEQIAFFDELKDKATVSKDTVLGQRLGKYLLTHFLGKGGMAVVYRGVTGDHKTGEHVAVKVLSAVDDGKTVERFKREVQICQKLFHPNIVALHDWGMNDELIYLALELVEGGTLEDRIEWEVGLPLNDGLRIFDEILAGMEFAHAQGVTHRDLKPDNIMMTKNGKVKIADFGLAKLQNIKTVTATGAVMGTPAYMAPEQIQGEPPSPSMDQYALGVVAFQIFTGYVPFDCEDMMQTITKHLIEPAPNPKDFNETLPDGLCQMILRMLEKSPSDRFADLTEVRRFLRQFSRG